eukprot:TRINITY_DN36554_c0_g1_i1.p1 TRINITY_DN36554_c0_g1~~TRINITY_DN36554_c0_g1_i1.p1  ORF type:complete len:208 (+),score=50.11 TRINITY_DN36554_c0_g1_i1:45-626(+)
MAPRVETASAAKALDQLLYASAMPDSAMLQDAFGRTLDLKLHSHVADTDDDEVSTDDERPGESGVDVVHTNTGDSATSSASAKSSASADSNTPRWLRRAGTMAAAVMQEIMVPSRGAPICEYSYGVEELSAPNHKQAVLGTSGFSPEEIWSCRRCTLDNPPTAEACEACAALRSAAPSPVAPQVLGRGLELDL